MLLLDSGICPNVWTASLKVLEFTSRLEKSLNSVKVLEKYLISLLGLEKSLKFTALSKPGTFFCIKLDYFDEESLAHPQCKNL